MEGSEGEDATVVEPPTEMESAAVGSDLEEAAATVAGDSDGARRWERVNHEETAVGALWAGAGAAARSVGASSVVRENHDAEAHHPRQVDVSVTAEDMAPLPALPASPPAPPAPPSPPSPPGGSSNTVRRAPPAEPLYP